MCMNIILSIDFLQYTEMNKLVIFGAMFLLMHFLWYIQYILNDKLYIFSKENCVLLSLFHVHKIQQFKLLYGVACVCSLDSVYGFVSFHLFYVFSFSYTSFYVITHVI